MSLIYSLPELMSLMGYYVDSEYYDVFRVLEAIALFFPVLGGIVSLVCSTFPIINAASYCVIRAEAKNESRPMKTGAYNVLVVVAIINLVICCIGMLWRLAKSVIAILSQLVAGVVSLGTVQQGLAALGIGFEVALIIEIFALMVSVTISVVSIVYYLKYIKTVNSVKKVIKTGNIKKLPSKFVGVMSYISAAFNILYALVIAVMLIPGGALFNNITPREVSLVVFAVLLMLWFAVGAVAQICAGAVIFNIRDYFEDVKCGRGQPIITEPDLGTSEAPVPDAESVAEETTEEIVAVEETPAAESAETVQEPADTSAEAVTDTENPVEGE